MRYKSVMMHHVIEPVMRRTVHTGQCESIKPIPMSHHSRSRAPTLAYELIALRSAHLNIPKEVKLWHKSAPLLITAVTILGLVVIFHH
jgi:hypothetical protein